jgi:hypothetical protein
VQGRYRWNSVKGEFRKLSVGDKDDVVVPRVTMTAMNEKLDALTLAVENLTLLVQQQQQQQHQKATFHGGFPYVHGEIQHVELYPTSSIVDKSFQRYTMNSATTYAVDGGSSSRTEAPMQIESTRVTNNNNTFPAMMIETPVFESLRNVSSGLASSGEFCADQFFSSPGEGL